MTKPHPKLVEEIEHLATSDEFKEMARQNNFKNLLEITKIPIIDFLKMPGVNHRMLAELGIILNGYGLIDLMKEV